MLEIREYPFYKSEHFVAYHMTATEPPKHGIPILGRIVSPYSTLVVDGGQIILDPGKSIVIYIGSFLPVVFDSVKFAFGWWEKYIYKYPNCSC